MTSTPLRHPACFWVIAPAEEVSQVTGVWVTGVWVTGSQVTGVWVSGCGDCGRAPWGQEALMSQARPVNRMVPSA